MDGGTEDVGEGEGELEGGLWGDLGGGEGEVVIEGARECPEGARGVIEEGRGGAKDDDWGGSWQDVQEVYTRCVWGISCMLLLLFFVYFNFVLYLCYFYDVEIELVDSTKPYKFKSVGNSRECSWESYGWYKYGRNFF